jgi:hypothetical protein
MAFQLKEGYGNLFKNEKKEKESHADYNGTIMVNGKEHWLNAWIKDGKNGKFMSLSIGKEKIAKTPNKESGDNEGFYDDPLLF